MVALVAPLPDAVIPDPVGPRHVVHQVLQEVALVAGLHHHQAGAGELCQLQQKESGGIELQMAPAVIRHYRCAASGVVFGVQCVERFKAVFEALHLVGLAQHGVEQAAHQLQHPLLQFKHTGGGTAQAAVRQG